MHNLLLISKEPAAVYDLDGLNEPLKIHHVQDFDECLPILSTVSIAVIVVETEGKDASVIFECSRIHTYAADSFLIVASDNKRLEFEELIFEAGADDFVGRPCSSHRLRAHIKAALRFVKVSNKGILRCGDIELDCERGTATMAGTPIELRSLEFKLLEFLVRHPNETFTSEALCRRVWSKGLDASETLRTHIKTLRKKLHGQSLSLTTQYRRGYKLVV
jgi:two-component system, OmpR family, response regulator RegX3